MIISTLANLFAIKTCNFIIALLYLLLDLRLTTADPLKKSPQDIAKALKHWAIIPDVIDVPPRKAVRIYYESEVYPDFGNELNAEDCSTEPYMIEWDSEEDKSYLLLMVDPDVPSQANPVNGQYEHFVLGNIQFDNLLRGTYISDYHGPHPAPQTGYHRYVFLIYEQPYELEYAEKRLTWPKYGDRRRFNFSAKRYAAKYYLGQPVACNFFISKWEPPRNVITTTQSSKPTWKWHY